MVDGKAPLSDAFEKFDLEDSEEDFEASTVSGWIIEKLGEIPHAGKKFDYENIAVEVMKSTVKRVLQAKITVLDKKTEEDDD